jgi:hypothetical protein
MQGVYTKKMKKSGKKLDKNKRAAYDKKAGYPQPKTG